MTDEQRQILRGVVEADKDNCISIAILALLDMVDEQKDKLSRVMDACPEPFYDQEHWRAIDVHNTLKEIIES